MGLRWGMPGPTFPCGSGPCEIQAPSSLSMSGVPHLAASSALIVGSAECPFQGSCFGGRLFSSPNEETAGGIMCRLQDFPTVRYQKLVGGEAESCLREADVPEFQGFGIFAEYYHSKA